MPNSTYKSHYYLFRLYTTGKSFVIFTHRYFKLSWNTTALSRSNCRNFSCSSIKLKGHLRHEYLIKYAYFDKMLFRTVCFYQWSWKLNYKCSLMALAIWVHFRSSNFRHVTDNWELMVKIFTLKWGKDDERTTSSFRYVSEAIKNILKNSPCMCDCVI